MKQITVSRLFNLGDYENEKIEVVIDLEENETVTQGYQRGLHEISLARESEKIMQDYEACKCVVENPDRFTGLKVKEAQKTMNAIKGNYPELFPPVYTSSDESKDVKVKCPTPPLDTNE